MAAVEVPHTASHVGMPQHDLFPKNRMNVNDGHNHDHGHSVSDDQEEDVAPTDQIDSRSLSQTERSGQSFSTFAENDSLMEARQGNMNEESTSNRCGEHVKTESSNSVALLNSSIQECVENAISEKSYQRVTDVLNKVSQLSNAEKLFLYLKLPTGNSEIPLKVNPNYPLGNRTHVSQAFTWIRTHLDEDNEVSLQKDEVYQSYKAYCSLHQIKVLSQADFGKAIKQVFPNVKPRRLGMRGHSKYCYSGLCKRKQVPVPNLPDLEELKMEDSVGNGSSKSESGTKMDLMNEDLTNSSSLLICKWAHKLLNQTFNSIHELAYHLVSNGLVNELMNSLEAVTLVSHFSKQNSENSHQASMLLNNNNSGNKHKDAQLQLQRKLKEKERIKEQRRKIIECQSSSSKPGSEKSRTKKCTSQKTRHGSGSKLQSGSDSSKKSTNVPKKIGTRSYSANDASASTMKRPSVDMNKNSHPFGECENGLVSDPPLKNSNQLQRNQNGDKCIIIVPSIQLSNPSKAKPKYKPIQPKPKIDESVHQEEDSMNMNSIAQSNGSSGTVDHVVDENCSSEKSVTARTRLKRPSGSKINEDDIQKKANVNNIGDGHTDVQQTVTFAQKVSMPSNECIFNQEKTVSTNENRKISQLRKILESNYTPKYATEGQTQVPSQDIGCTKSIFKGLQKPDAENVQLPDFKAESVHLHNSSFQFTPISNKTVAASESLCSTTQSSLANSPIPTIHNSNHPSINLFGPQTNDSPFVSPRETPLSRSRHNSGQASARPYSSDGSGSPFASPLGTPVHARSRHGSGVQASVLRFSASTNNRFPAALSSVREISNMSQPELYSRCRHLSGNTLSPLSKSAPMSPMYSQFSNSQPDLTQESYHKHVTQDTVYQALPNRIPAPLPSLDTSHELKMYLQKTPPILSAMGNSRCQSVPLCQMLNECNFSLMNNQNAQGMNTLPFSKSYPATPCENQEFTFSAETAEQFANYLNDQPSNLDYNTLPSDDNLLQMPYSNPIQTPPTIPPFSDSLVDMTSTENYDQSNQLLFNSQNSDLADCSEQPNNESAAYNEVLQSLEVNFTSPNLNPFDEFISM